MHTLPSWTRRRGRRGGASPGTVRRRTAPDGRNGRNGRNERNGHDERLALVASVAPLIAQAVMLAAMIAARRWLFALMIAPSLIGCAASALSSWRRMHRRPDASPGSPAPRGGPAAVTGRADGDGTARRSAFDGIPAPRWETLHGLDAARDRLAWRTVVRRWLGPDDMGALIGADARGPYRLDLRASGPHALVAGTTGAGKSVLLQSWCLSLASMVSPKRLNFVFLDFKGGSAFNRLDALPHTVGCVCDLDLAHASRALTALEMEIRRRERLVGAHRAAHVDELDDPPPRLVVMVDEFHALRSQLPDYVDRLVRVAALGRSLGMHLIACTQNPIGQVSADMKANIAINLCLRVRDPMQSSELLGTPDAAAISPAMPGAAYCADGQSLTALRCAAVGDLDAAVAMIDTARRFCALPAAPPLFSAPLPSSVTVPAHARAPGGRIPPGAVPDSIVFALGDDGVQLHDASLPLLRGNVAVVGPRGRGKTTLLRLLAELVSERPGMQVRFTHRTPRGFVTRTLHRRAAPAGVTGADAPPARPQLVWLIDDADGLLDPLSNDPMAAELRAQLAHDRTTVVFAAETMRHIRVPDHCTTRVMFPTGERNVDLMDGIPSAVIGRLTRDDIDTAGRAVLLDRGHATPVQCFLGNS